MADTMKRLTEKKFAADKKRAEQMARAIAREKAQDAKDKRKGK